MKLEVGKTYLSRCGDSVKIKGSNDSIHYPFRGDDDRTYQANGRYFDDVTECENDLVSEVVVETPSVVIGPVKGLTQTDLALRLMLSAYQGFASLPEKAEVAPPPIEEFFDIADAFLAESARRNG